MRPKPTPPVARRTVVCAIVCAVLAGGGCHAWRPAAPRDLAIERVELVGDFTTNAWAYGRDAGNSIRMGNEILWVFGDTFTWTGLPCATAAWSPVDDPTNLHEPVDPWFGSFQFYEPTPDEAAYNESRDPPECCTNSVGCNGSDFYCHCPPDTDCTKRIALWPGDLLAIDDEQAFEVYEKVLIGSYPYDFHHLGTGAATVRRGATTATRVRGADGEPLLLFGPDEPNFLRAVRVEEDDRVRAYLFAVTNRRECDVDILLARVDLDAVFDRASYEFWNGQGWSASLDEAAPILHQIVGGLGSVTWNDHLNQYLSAFNDICTGGHSLVLRTAPRPEGPWSAPTEVDIRSLGATGGAYAGQIHSSLGSGRSPVFTFYQPLEIELGIGKVRIGRLQLR